MFEDPERDSSNPKGLFSPSQSPPWVLANILLAKSKVVRYLDLPILSSISSILGIGYASNFDTQAITAIFLS